MNGSLKTFKLIRTLNYLSSTRTIYNENLVHPKGQKTIEVQEDDDQKIFACIHLEPTFPYEHTKALPKIEVKEVDSVLNNVVTCRGDLPKKDLTFSEVQKLTYTSELYWRPKHDYKKTYKKKMLKPREGP